MEVILCLIDCPGTIIGSEIDVTDEITTLRGVDTKAKKTIVSNLGATRFKIFEDGLLVQVLWPGKTWESPVSGRLLIEAMADTGQIVRAAITTHRRCDCDIGSTNYGDVTEPIGGHLV